MSATPESNATAVARLETLAGLPRDAEGPVFRAPWEAQAFAMALALIERGVVGWHEWTAALAAAIRDAQARGDPDTGDTYYLHWMSALETIVAEKGLFDAATLLRRKRAWDTAARNTPHGKPITL